MADKSFNLYFRTSIKNDDGKPVTYSGTELAQFLGAVGNPHTDVLLQVLEGLEVGDSHVDHHSDEWVRTA